MLLYLELLIKPISDWNFVILNTHPKTTSVYGYLSLVSRVQYIFTTKNYRFWKSKPLWWFICWWGAIYLSL